MARPLRLEYPGAVYHLTSRGNGRNAIYWNDDDRKIFLSILAKVVERYNWICHAFCLMNNHYHLLVETPDPTLSIGMRYLNGVYTQSFNRCHNRVGHVFQGRFKSIIVEKNAYLLELCRYIVLNPIRAAIVTGPGCYQWSSYNATACQNEHKNFLTVNWLLGQFAGNADIARERYKSFVMDGVNKKINPWSKLQGQVILGSERFVYKVQERIGSKKTIKEIPREQRLPLRPKLAEIFNGETTKKFRDEQIQKAHFHYGYLLKEIAEYLNIHYSTVSRIINSKEASILYFKT